jgi:hypothetical protein
MEQTEISIGQIMAEVLCQNNLNETDNKIYSEFGELFNSMSFESRTIITESIGSYIKSCGIDITK